MNGAVAKLHPVSPKRQKVLVIDDDLVICKFMERIISDAGHEVRTVRDGLSALDVLHFYRPHIIFLDLVLPDVDGRTLCRMIREKNELKCIYIAIFSGILLEENLDISQLGADALVAKGPISQMDESVRQVLIDPEGVRERCRSGEIVGTENIHPRKMTTELLSSNQRFNLVLDNMGQGILELSSDGRILFVNKAAASFFKKADVELLATTFTSLIDQKDRHRVAELIKHQGEIFSIPVNAPLALHDRLFSMEILPYTSKKGHISLIMTDVTRINRESDSLKTEEERLRRIINHLSDAVILANAQGFVQLVNPAAEKLFGRKMDAFIGSSFGFPMLTDEPSELDIINTDGTLKVGEMRSVEIYWKGEKACLAAIRDITARKQMEEDLKNANEKILAQQERIIEEERLKVLLQMAGATAHEINQPLSVLLGNVELLEMDSDDPEAFAESLREIKMAGKRIADIGKKVQNIHYYDSKPYDTGATIVNIDQDIQILSIEDSDGYFETIKTVFEGMDHVSLIGTKTIEGALTVLIDDEIDLILLDYALPDGNGFDFLEKARKEGIETPVVILTGKGGEMIASRLIREGASDYLTKTAFDRETISRIIWHVLEKTRLKREVGLAQVKLAQMATRDVLTGLHNRRYFFEALEREKARAERYGTDLVVCMIDLDHFKRINDSHGHPAGDAVLSGIGKLIRQWARETDLPGRYGGEEFAVVLPETNPEGGLIACERLRRMVAEHRFEHENLRLNVTISIGMAHCNKTAQQTVFDLMNKADEALYRAKNKGRNRVVG